jgi:hypothetical protein
MDVLSVDFLSVQMFCTHGCIVPRMFCPTDVMSPDVLSPQVFFGCLTFCPFGNFVAPDVLSLQTFCPCGRFVPVRYVSGRYVCGHFVWAPRIQLRPDDRSAVCQNLYFNLHHNLLKKCTYLDSTFSKNIHLLLKCRIIKNKMMILFAHLKLNHRYKIDRY